MCISWKDAATDDQRGGAPVDAVIVGGCGIVGLPLGIALASRGLSVVLYDINAAAVATVNSGTLPFAEEVAAELLATATRDGRLWATTDPASVSTAETSW
jgi:UDP-N-acetyl-D-mannosaminuronic acid dehydrogenase